MLNKNLAFGLSIALGCSALICSSTASAALQVRSIGGDYGVYDDVSNLTWLDSAAFNQFYTQSEAQTLVDGLTSFGVSDWRLPTVGTNPSDFSMPADNELVVLWQHLGNSTEDAFSGSTGGLFNTPFPSGYWNAETDWATYLGSDGTWQTASLPYGIWAVRTGDVANGNVPSVPVPAAAWLFGTALTGLGVIGRRKSK